jgi:hypothetical protein
MKPLHFSKVISPRVPRTEYLEELNVRVATSVTLRGKGAGSTRTRNWAISVNMRIFFCGLLAYFPYFEKIKVGL